MADTTVQVASGGKQKKLTIAAAGTASEYKRGGISFFPEPDSFPEGPKAAFTLWWTIPGWPGMYVGDGESRRRLDVFIAPINREAHLDDPLAPPSAAELSERYKAIDFTSITDQDRDYSGCTDWEAPFQMTNYRRPPDVKRDNLKKKGEGWVSFKPQEMAYGPYSLKEGDYEKYGVTKPASGTGAMYRLYVTATKTGSEPEILDSKDLVVQVPASTQGAMNAAQLAHELDSELLEIAAHVKDIDQWRRLLNDEAQKAGQLAIKEGEHYASEMKKSAYVQLLIETLDYGRKIAKGFGEGGVFGAGKEALGELFGNLIEHAIENKMKGDKDGASIGWDVVGIDENEQKNWEKEFDSKVMEQVGEKAAEMERYGVELHEAMKAESEEKKDPEMITKAAGEDAEKAKEALETKIKAAQQTTKAGTVEVGKKGLDLWIDLVKDAKLELGAARREWHEVFKDLMSEEHKVLIEGMKKGQAWQLEKAGATVLKARTAAIKEAEHTYKQAFKAGVKGASKVTAKNVGKAVAKHVHGALKDAAEDAIKDKLKHATQAFFEAPAWEAYQEAELASVVAMRVAAMGNNLYWDLTNGTALDKEPAGGPGWYEQRLETRDKLKAVAGKYY